MENGLQVVSKKFDEIEEIYSLEFIDSDEKLLVVGRRKDSDKLVFIIWDIYKTGGSEIKENFPIVNGQFEHDKRFYKGIWEFVLCKFERPVLEFDDRIVTTKF